MHPASADIDGMGQEMVSNGGPEPMLPSSRQRPRPASAPMNQARSVPAMEHQTLLPADGPNALGTMLGVLGDEWSLWIVQQAIAGRAFRYRDWIKPGVISNSVLTGRLAQLTDAGIFVRVETGPGSARHEYRLTQRGRDLWPMLLAMHTWELNHTWPRNPNLPDARHLTCGAVFTPQLTCEHCGETVEAQDVAAKLGPSGDWSRSMPGVTTRRRSTATEKLAHQIPATMTLIGNRWSSAMLAVAFLGATRFSEFADRLGAPPTIVIDRLRTFCDIGVLKEVPSVDRASWVTYQLTDTGLAFFPVIAFMVDWSQRWFHAPDGDALIMRHRQCGELLHPRLSCDQCGQLVHGREVNLEPHT